MPTADELGHAAYVAQAAARAAFQNALYVQRAGSAAAYLALYNNTKALAGVHDLDVNEWEIDEEDENKQKA